ncbi:beta-N-acetylhexosaminidase [Alphaproteobacteria bacterium]|nr:beta-N-acetylhexosaminidase [Alphaproteobacteria bacterium]
MSESSPSISAGKNPIIFGLQTTHLTPDERQFLDQSRPWGVVLFARNIETREQLTALTDDLREALDNPHLPILIDQEGGRVARLKPPLVPAYPPADVYYQLYLQDKEKGREAAYLGGYLLAADLHDLGITVNCAPVLDFNIAGMSDIIGDRAFGKDLASISALGRAFMEGQHKAGVLSVGKHFPGHGRSRVDSHFELPVVTTPGEVLSATDFAVFKAFQDLPMGMTGHLLFRDIDPDLVSTFSPIIVQKIIRQEIGFTGLLMSDDLSMQALHGDFTQRARASLQAGCDVVLHCNGQREEMAAILQAMPDRPNPQAAQRMAAVDGLLAALPTSLNAEERAQAQQDWGELVGGVFPDGRKPL